MVQGRQLADSQEHLPSRGISRIPAPEENLGFGEAVIAGIYRSNRWKCAVKFKVMGKKGGEDGDHPPFTVDRSIEA